MATITGTTGADDIFDGNPLAPTSGDDTIYGDTRTFVHGGGASLTYLRFGVQRHGLVISEGAVSETYLDDGNRHLFENAGVGALAMDFEAWRGNGRYAAGACAPVLAEGDPALGRIRARLDGGLRRAG